MKAGIMAPKKIVVIKTNNKTELFNMLILGSLSGLFIVKISAKATEPRIIPATVTINNYQFDTFHFL